jgi:integrase
MSSRRGSKEGTITKRADGRWEARLTLESGKRKCFYARSRQEVARLLAEALRDQAKGLSIVGDKQTLAQYLKSWLEMSRPTIRASTWWRYEELTRVHILPVLGSFPLSRLTAQHLNTFYAAKLGEGLSPTTVRYIHVTLHRALGEALRSDSCNVMSASLPDLRVRPDVKCRYSLLSKHACSFGLWKMIR